MLSYIMSDSMAARPPRRSIAERLFWVPPHLRWDPSSKHELTWTQIIFYSLVRISFCFYSCNLAPFRGISNVALTFDCLHIP